MTRLPSLHIPCLLVTPVPCFFSSPRLLLLPHFPFIPANKPFSPRAPSFTSHRFSLLPHFSIPLRVQVFFSTCAFFHQSSPLLTPSLLYSPPSTGFLFHVRLLPSVIASHLSLTSHFSREQTILYACAFFHMSSLPISPSLNLSPCGQNILSACTFLLRVIVFHRFLVLLGFHPRGLEQ